MNIHPIELTHRQLLTHKFQQLNWNLSEYSFANLFLFREIHRYVLISINDHLFIRGVTRDQQPFIMLTQEPSSEYIHALFTVMQQVQVFVIYPIPNSQFNYFEKYLVNASFKEEDSDYLFATEKMKKYPGGHLSSKRNLVKQLFTSHQVTSHSFERNELPAARQILKQWELEFLQKQDAMHTQNSIDSTDFQACLEAFDLFEHLSLKGRVIFIEDKPLGFVLGEYIHSNCFVIHFSKACKEIKGSYQYLMQDLAQHLDVQWINFEQDLGLPALRQSKQSYMPDQLLQKWRLELSISSF